MRTPLFLDGLVVVLLFAVARPSVATRPTIQQLTPGTLTPHPTSTTTSSRSTVSRHKHKARCSPPSSSLSFTSDTLRVRGGGMENIPELLAETATVGTGAVAAMTYLAPAPAAQSLYGLPNTSPLVVWLIRALGGSLAMIAIQAYCILYKGMAYTRAVGFGCLPFMLNEIRTLVLHETRQWNMPPWGLLFISLPISSSCAYVLISDRFTFKKNMVKLFAFWLLVGNGLPLSLAPEAAAKRWGIDTSERGALESLQLFGFADIAAAMFMMLLDRGVTAAPAFASSFVLLVVLILNRICAFASAA